MQLLFILLALISTYVFFFQRYFFLNRPKHYFYIIMLLFFQICINISIIIFFIWGKLILIFHILNILNWILFFYDCWLKTCILRFFARIYFWGWWIFGFMRNIRSWLSHRKRFTKIMVTSLIRVCLSTKLIYLNYIISKQN